MVNLSMQPGRCSWVPRQQSMQLGTAVPRYKDVKSLRRRQCNNVSSTGHASACGSESLRVDSTC
jgi:hypothetical protein